MCRTYAKQATLNDDTLWSSTWGDTRSKMLYGYDGVCYTQRDDDEENNKEDYQKDNQINIYLKAQLNCELHFLITVFVLLGNIVL